MTSPAVYRARWVLPVTAPPIRDGALVVDEGGIIRAVGPAAEIPLPATAQVTDLGEAALLPGLVNAHMHLELSFLRGMLEDLPFTDWIPALLAARRAAGLGEADCLAAARWSLIEALAAGITSVGATEDSQAAMLALRETGQRGVVYREVFGPAPGQCAEAMARLDGEISRMRDTETDLVRAGVSPHAPYTVSDALFRAVARFALDRSLPVAVHVAESPAESSLVTRGEGVFAERLRARGIAAAPRARSPLALLDVMGVLETRPILIHCVHVDDADIERIARTGAAVVHCPIANARLGHGVAPVGALRAAGVTVALGSDSVASNNRVDVLEEARTAQLFRRALGGDPGALPAAELLRMATLDGARALGLVHRVGSLEAGKDADLCAVSLAGPHVRPAPDPLAALFHAARASDVSLTVVRGRVLYRDGRFEAIDAPAAAGAIDALAARVPRVTRPDGARA
jgi:5-methylthioadenosine/S-adenosylhomocysteine deaminase